MPVKNDCSTQQIDSPKTVELSDDLKIAIKLLGPIAHSLSQTELKELIAETKYLAQSWLNDFERQAFEGKTLSELLYEEDIRNI